MLSSTCMDVPVGLEAQSRCWKSSLFHFSVCSRLPQSNLEFTDECIVLADLDFLSLVSKARITGELPYLPGIYQDARDLNSSILAQVESCFNH